MISTETAERLGKLLPRLASEHDGEVVATARAIGRTLTAAGLDWHTIGHAVIDAAEWGVILNPAGTGGAPRPWPDIDPDDPTSPARKGGMTIWGVYQSWRDVAVHCLSVHGFISKACGGKFLTKDERDRLKAVRVSGYATNATAEMMESVVTRLDAARERWLAQNRRAA